MSKKTVVFIAVTDYHNLGVGYMTALLTEAGFKTRLLDVMSRKSDILKTLRKLDPVLIGFSVIFLSYLQRFAGLIEYLRKGGINCHFTAGGHYASLKYQELLQIAPRLDSIVRFEGEYPVLELAKCLYNGSDWRMINSLTFRGNDKLVCNPVWPPEPDIDKFPYPLRTAFKKYAFNKKFTTILAGRGCLHNCSFCNTREFYHQASGPLKRIRKPELVVNEMNYLYKEKRCSVFLFHDDDFPVKSYGKQNWIVRFCKELERTGLNKKIIWKINCRPDDVKEETFSLMKKNGLFLVFLGLEDGTEEGLEKLNKQSTPEDNIRGITILKKLRIRFDYGFMLFQPSTTFVSLNENLNFLSHIGDDGHTPVTFLKLIPLYETRIEKELINEGRLFESNGIQDYNFPEEAMNRYYRFITQCFYEWQRDPNGVENLSKWARNYVLVYMKYFVHASGPMYYCNKIRKITAECNKFLLDCMTGLSEFFKTGKDIEDNQLLGNYMESVKLKHNFYKKVIIESMAKILDYVEDHNS